MGALLKCKVLVLVALIAFSGCARTISQPGIVVVAASQSQGGIEVELELPLTPEVTEAIDQGVPVSIRVQAKISLQRPWLWDPTIAGQTVDLQLRYHALSRQYVVRGPDSKSLRRFRQLADLLDAAEGPFFIALPNQPLSTSRYASVRAWLDIPALPPPLRLPAYVSPAWRLDSGWLDAMQTGSGG